MPHPVQHTCEHRIDGRLTGQCVIDASAVESCGKYFRRNQCRFSFAFAHIGFDDHQSRRLHGPGQTGRLTLHRTHTRSGNGEALGEHLIGRLPRCERGPWPGNPQHAPCLVRPSPRIKDLFVHRTLIEREQSAIAGDPIGHDHH